MNVRVVSATFAYDFDFLDVPEWVLVLAVHVDKLAHAHLDVLVPRLDGNLASLSSTSKTPASSRNS